MHIYIERVKSNFNILIGITPTFLYLDMYLNTTYAAHYVYFRLYYPCRHYTNLFIFRFVSEHCLRSTLCLFRTLLSVSAVHQPFYISICIWTPTQHAMFISDFTIRIGSIPTFLYFDLYLNTAYTQHTIIYICSGSYFPFIFNPSKAVDWKQKLMLVVKVSSDNVFRVGKCFYL